MYNLKATYYNFVPRTDDTATKILALASKLQSEGKTDGDVMRYNEGDNGENFVSERIFTTLDSATEFKDCICSLWSSEEVSVDISEITP